MRQLEKQAQKEARAKRLEKYNIPSLSSLLPDMEMPDMPEMEMPEMPSMDSISRSMSGGLFSFSSSDDTNIAAEDEEGEGIDDVNRKSPSFLPKSTSRSSLLKMQNPLSWLASAQVHTPLTGYFYYIAISSPLNLSLISKF